MQSVVLSIINLLKKPIISTSRQFHWHDCTWDTPCQGFLLKPCRQPMVTWRDYWWGCFGCIGLNPLEVFWVLVLKKSKAERLKWHQSVTPLGCLRKKKKEQKKYRLSTPSRDNTYYKLVITFVCVYVRPKGRGQWLQRNHQRNRRAAKAPKLAEPPKAAAAKKTTTCFR